KDDLSPVEDHDLQLVTEGRGACVIDGVEHLLEKGDFITILPGETFYIKAYGDMPFTRYFIHMDFFRDEERRTSTPLLSNGHAWPRLIRLNYDLDVRNRCAELVLHRFSSGSTTRILADGELTSLIGLVLAQYERSGVELQMCKTKCRRSILKAERFIRRNFNRPMTVEEMAEVAELSTNYFSSMFKAVVGRTPVDYLTDYRIKQAKRLMVETDHTIGEIASLVGIGDIHYFSYLFKRREGITPSEFISRFSRDE
ncbi:MAG TPA: AraC family transcriptional regulator, partial [Armatimonadota bacterium]